MDAPMTHYSMQRKPLTGITCSIWTRVFRLITVNFGPQHVMPANGFSDSSIGPEFIKLGQKFGTPQPKNLAAKKHQNFRQIFDSFRTRSQISVERNEITLNGKGRCKLQSFLRTCTSFGEIWSTNGEKIEPEFRANQHARVVWVTFDRENLENKTNIVKWKTALQTAISPTHISWLPYPLLRWYWAGNQATCRFCPWGHVCSGSEYLELLNLAGNQAPAV